MAPVTSQWVFKALALMPESLHRALDGWSRRVALRRLEKRRAAGRRPAPAAPLAYRLKPWRD